MIFEIALVVVIFANLAFYWYEIAKQEKEIRDLKTRTRFLESEGWVLHSIKEKGRDFEARIRYLETEEARRKRM